MAEKDKIEVDYNEDSIRSLDWKEHIRLRPGMYIGKLGDGSSPDDGIYVLMKEVIDNCIDEHTMGYGRHVDVSISGKNISVRDYGRGIPSEKLASFHHTGAGVGVGLGGMKERVAELGGHLRVECGGKGTCVTATVPLTMPEKASRQPNRGHGHTAPAA